MHTAGKILHCPDFLQLVEGIRYVVSVFDFDNKLHHFQGRQAHLLHQVCVRCDGNRLLQQWFDQSDQLLFDFCLVHGFAR